MMSGRKTLAFQYGVLKKDPLNVAVESAEKKLGRHLDAGDRLFLRLYYYELATRRSREYDSDQGDGEPDASDFQLLQHIAQSSAADFSRIGRSGE